MSKEEGTRRGIECAEASNVGRQRLENQDSYCTVRGEGFLFAAVADGMGGARGGGIASATAIEVCARHIAGACGIDETRIREALCRANAAIQKIAKKEAGLSRMGTTFTAAAVTRETIFLANIGDSRVYLLRRGRLEQLTQDHTVIGELLRAGAVTAHEVEGNTLSHLLSRSLGSVDADEIECWRSDIKPEAGDRFLLCTDGLYNHVSGEALIELAGSGPPRAAVARLIEAANAAGGSDNITAIVVEIGPDFGADAEAPPQDGRQNVVTICTSASLAEKALHGSPGDNAAPVRHSGRQRRGLFSGAVLVAVAGVCLLSFYRSAPQQAGSGADRRPVSLAELAQQVPQTEERFRDTLSQITNALSLPETADYDTRAKYARWLPLSDEPQDDANHPEPAASPQDLDAALDRLRSRIDVETRKLAIWYERRKLCESVEPHTLAAAVAISSPEVRAKKALFEKANMLYLEAAEKLLYNPADEEQEAAVAELSAARDAAREALNQEVSRAIETMVGKSLQRILDLAIARDKVMAEQRSLKKGEK